MVKYALFIIMYILLKVITKTIHIKQKYVLLEFLHPQYRLSFLS